MGVAMFDPELRTLSVVPRWTVIRTLGKDTVAAHSFYVALYADEIAAFIGWKGNKHLLLKYALFHDAEESLTGDVPGPVKKFIMSRDGAVWLRQEMSTWLPSVHSFREFFDRSFDYGLVGDIELITKAADKIDALIFILTELRQGNKHLESTAGELWVAAEDAWLKLSGLSEGVGKGWLAEVWETHVRPAIAAHNENGGRGLWPA
jgi:5'-deoxynucleotidase